MKSFEVARLFERMADLLEIRGENPFRIRAYRRAAQSLESMSEDLEQVAREGRLEEIPGVGADLAGKIAEYLETGRMRDVEAAARGVPDGVVELLGVPGIGPKTAKLLYEKQHVTSLARLEELARAGRLRGAPGIQKKTEENILRGIELLRKGQERMPLGHALPLAEEIVDRLERAPGTKRIEIAGSLRRRKETVGDIDLLVTSSKPERVIAAFASLPEAAEVLEKGSTRATIRHREGIQVDLRVLAPESFGAGLVYFTGSKLHNIKLRDRANAKGLKISEYGVFREATGRRIAGATEEEVYGSVGLPWIPPEIREDSGEIEAAAAGRLPRLVDLRDLRGDLHCHTRASDGRHTLAEVAAAAAARGYEYLAIADHSPSARIAGGLGPDEMLAHVRSIRALEKKHPGLTLFAACECDILPDGSLDYPESVLSELEFVVGAVHGRFRQPKEEMTRRICRALANPHLAILGHPTGRKIGERTPYEIDLEEVLRTAKRHGKAVEINAQPERLDLGDRNARRARDLGVLLAIDTDMHVLDQLDWLHYGVAVARRAWVEKEEVVNTWPRERLVEWLRSARSPKRAGTAERRRRGAA